MKYMIVKIILVVMICSYATTLVNRICDEIQMARVKLIAIEYELKTIKDNVKRIDDNVWSIDFDVSIIRDK